MSLRGVLGILPACGCSLQGEGECEYVKRVYRLGREGWLCLLGEVE